MSNKDIIELLNEYVKKRGKLHKEKHNLRDIIKINQLLIIAIIRS